MINNKDKYLLDIEKRFSGKVKELLIEQVNLYYEDVEINKNRYSVNDDVFLKKGTFIHGIFGELDNFDFTLENGFISTDFTMQPRENKICNSVGM